MIEMMMMMMMKHLAIISLQVNLLIQGKHNKHLFIKNHLLLKKTFDQNMILTERRKKKVSHRFKDFQPNCFKRGLWFAHKAAISPFSAAQSSNQFLEETLPLPFLSSIKK